MTTLHADSFFSPDPLQETEAAWTSKDIEEWGRRQQEQQLAPEMKRLNEAAAFIRAATSPYWKDAPEPLRLAMLNAHREELGQDPVKALPEKRGFDETLIDLGSGAIPYLGSVLDIKELWQVKGSLERMDEGKAGVGDVRRIADFQEQLAEDLQDRTFLGEVARFSGESLPFMVEFGLAIGTGGSAGLAGAAGSAGRKALLKTITKMLTKQIASAGRSVAQAAIKMPHRVIEETLRNYVGGFEVTGDSAGRLHKFVTDPGDDFLPALAKGLGDVGIEVYTEKTGELLSVINKAPAAIGRKIGIPLEELGELKTAFLGRIAKQENIKSAGELLGFLKERGYHGITPEIYEEAFGEFLRVTQAKAARVAGLDEYALAAPESYVEAAREFIDQLPAMATSFAAMGAGAAGAGAITSVRQKGDIEGRLAEIEEPPPVEPPPTGQVTREQLEAATPKLEPSEPAAPPAKPAAPRTAYLERIADAVQEKASPELLGEIAQQEEGVTPAQFKQLGIKKIPSKPRRIEIANIIRERTQQEVPRAVEAAEAPAPAETQAAPVQEEVTEAPAPRGKAVRFRSKRKGVRFGELLGPAEREGFLTIALPDGGTVDVKQDAVIGEEAPAAVPVEQKAEVRPAVQGKVTENEVTVAQRPAEAEGARGETTDVKGERHLYEQPDPDSLESHLRPGEPFESMGAAENPDYEVGPGGAFRAIVRTAKDLMGPDTDKAPSQKYASPNEKIEETYQEAAQGIPKKRFAQMWTDFKEKVAGTIFRRSFYHLPINEENAEARSAIREHRFAPMYAFSMTDRAIQRITDPLDHDSYDLFQRSLWVNSLLEPTESGALPRDMNRDELKAEQERLKAHVEENEAVKAAIEYRRNFIWDKAVADYVKSGKRIGQDYTKKFYDVDEEGNATRRRPDYFRHQVLFHYAFKEQEAKHRGEPSKYGPKKGRGWLKTRKGTSLPVSAMYLQAEQEVLYQMILDTQRNNALGRLIENYDVRPMMMEEARRRREQARQFLKEEDVSDEDRAAAEEEAKITWEDLPIPKGHVKHYIERGNNIFPATSLDDRLAMELFEEVVEELNITKDDLNKVLALGAKKPPIIIPARLARQIQMEEANTKRHDVLAGIDNTIQFIVRWMKKFQLLGPRRFIGYNLRNLSEIEKVATINPGGFKQVPRAIKSLFQLYFKDKNKISDPDLEDWIKRGGAYTLWRVQELEQIPEEAQFRKLLEPPKKGTAANLRPDSLWRKYWDAIGLVTEFREAILRYANYLNYLEQIRTHGHPRNYGASHKENIQGLSDQKDQAFQLAADLLIDYSDASAMDEFFRKRFWPYWMFAGKNFAGYIQATKNLWNNDQAATKAGRAVLKKLGITGVRATPLVMMNVGRIAIMWYGFQALTALWNRGLFPDEDDELPDEIKRQPHITLGRDSEGKPRVFPRVGTALDALEWFGADSAYYDFRDLVNGRRSFQEIVEDMVYSPVNKFMNGVSPLIKAPFELAAGQSFYPDVRRPRRIRDPGEHLSRIIGFHDEYRRLSDRPQRESYGKSLLETPFTRVEPNQAHYWFVADKKRKFLEQQGRGLGYSDSARGDALYNYKLAVRFDDKDSAAKALAKYFALQGTAKGLNQSLESLHPLSGLNDEDEKKFIESLRAEERERLDGALRFYEEVLNPGVPFDISTLPSETARRDAIAYFSNQLIKDPPSREIPRDVREGKVIEYEEDKRKAANMFKANDMTRKDVLDAYRAYLDEDWRSPTTGKPMSGNDKAKRIKALRIELWKQGID